MNTRKITKNELDFEKMLNEVMPFIRRKSAETANAIEFDEMKSILMMQTWITWQTYDPSKGVKFSTYLFPALEHRRLMEIRALMAQKRGGGSEVCSLDAKVDEGNSRSCSFQSFISDMNKSNNPEERLIASEVTSIVYRVVNEQPSEIAKKMLLMVLDGEKQVEIARACSCQQSLVNYYLKKFRKQLANVLVKEGYGEFVPPMFQ